MARFMQRIRDSEAASVHDYEDLWQWVRRSPRAVLAAFGATQADCTVTVRGTPSTVPMRVRRVAFDDGTLRIGADVALDRTPYRMLRPWQASVAP
jgi:hypothetical protein